MLENEENLQAAFKKLRVDSERSTASLPVNEGASPQTFVESTDESKVKMTLGSKESWHWCLRKPLRGTIRTQRKGFSKPVAYLHLAGLPAAQRRSAERKDALWRRRSQRETDFLQWRNRRVVLRASGGDSEYTVPISPGKKIEENLTESSGESPLPSRPIKVRSAKFTKPGFAGGAPSSPAS
ncbi:oxidative stress-responsive serine-rich protein 1-like [Crotalus adamanteus]|uniref:Oxidative stress-responsive serine-rich protein 1 n=1 Tax=Crotalus adamanteus TaxID=8729 RepID=A0AAW1BS52_CROAD